MQGIPNTNVKYKKEAEKLLKPLTDEMFDLLLKYKTDCVKQCKASEDRSYCVGCGRTIQEIIEYGRRHAKETTKTS